MEKDKDEKELLARYLKELHLPAFRASYEERARNAQQEGLSFEQYLLGLAQRECQERQNKRVEELPRLRGRGKHRIDYRHVIDWLVRKPGAFADYRYRSDLFPSSRFRMAYDLLVEQRPERAAKEYLRILHLAAKESEVAVEAVLAGLLDAGGPVDANVVKERLRQQSPIQLATEVTVGPVDLAAYDALLDGKEAEDGEGQG